MRWWMLGGLALGVAGCEEEPPPPLNEDGQTISAFLFRHFDDADTKEMVRGLEEVLLPLMRTRVAAVADPSDDMSSDWLAELPTLEEEDLGTLTMPTGVTSAEQKFPYARVRVSDHPVADHRTLALEPNRICLESETTRWAEREFTSDTACFGDGSCSRLTAVQATYKQNPLAKIWYDQLFDLRVFELDDGAGGTVEALVTRGWIEERWFSRNGGNSWDQIWSLDVVIDEGEGSLGWNAYWTSLQVSLLTDGLLRDSIQGGLHQSAYWTEHFMNSGNAHEDCTGGPVNNDRDDEMPERWKNQGA